MDLVVADFIFLLPVLIGLLVDFNATLLRGTFEPVCLGIGGVISVLFFIMERLEKEKDPDGV